MKKLITLTIFALISLSSFGQLSQKAEYLKNNAPNFYEPIKEAAVKEWKTDHRMVVYEINRRSEAFMKWREYYLSQEEWSDERLILLRAMMDWKEREGDDMYYNWPMVVHEFERQMENYNSY